MIHRVLAFVAVLLVVTSGTLTQAVNTVPTGSCWCRRVVLRRLHLMRPDLIPYPIDFPVYA